MPLPTPTNVTSTRRAQGIPASVGGGGVERPIGPSALAPSTGPGLVSQQGMGDLGAIFQLIQQALAPSQAASQLTQGNLNDQLGAVLANQQNQGGLIQQGQGIDLARIGLSQEDLGIQQGALGRQQALAPQLEALTQQGFGISHEDINAARQRANETAERSLYANRSQQTARGSLVTEGNRTAIGNINEDLTAQLGGIGRQEQRLGIGEQQHALGYKEQQAQLADQQKHLGIISRGLGLSRQEVENRTQTALNQLGLSTALSTGDIYNAIIQAQAGAFSPITQLLPIISSISGITVPGG